MSLDPSKFKPVENNSNNIELDEKSKNKIATVCIICIILASITYGISIFFMFFYIVGVVNKSTSKTNTNNEQKDNLYEELQDANTKEYYQYDENDISQQDLHEHREDFWNDDGPIKYK